MNYTNDYEHIPENATLSTNSNDYHPYQLFTDSTRSEFTPMIFHTTPMNETNSMELMHPVHNYNNNHVNTIPPPFPSSPCKNTQSQRGIAGFVSKLYQYLQAPESDKKYARWCKHQGRDMFIIECIPEFTETVLPRLFKHCKFPSFVRQLNIYGFQRDTDARKSKDSKDKESCRWYHPYFRPDSRDLFHLIRRKETRYTRRKRAKQEEDPETILNIEGDDESAFEEDAQTVKSNNNNRRSSSSASSVRLPEYYPPPSQLQLSYEPPANTSSALIPLMEQSSEMIKQEPSTETNDANDKEADKHSHHADEPTTESTTEQELRLQLYHANRKCQQMRSYYDEQLNAARLKIQEQQLRIQQLESALSITEQHAVEPNSVQRPSGGYINTMCTTSLQPNCYTQPSSMYEISKLSQPFYFHSNHHSDTYTNPCLMQSYVKVKNENI